MGVTAMAVDARAQTVVNTWAYVWLLVSWTCPFRGCVAVYTRTGSMVVFVKIFFSSLGRKQCQEINKDREREGERQEANCGWKY